MKNISKIIKENRYELAILLVLFCSLVYCLNGTFNFDDVCYYYFRGQSYLDGSNLFDIIRNGERIWLFERGRFFPLNLAFEYVYYYVFNNWYFYEFFIILATCLDVFLFGCLIYEITQSKRNKLLGMLIIIVFFQVYCTYHNALVGYGALLQISVLFLISQLMLFARYLKSSDRKWLIFSNLFQLLGVMWYEVNYVNVVLAFVICCCIEKGSFYHKCKKCVIYSFPTLLCVVITLILRVTVPSSYKGTTISFNLIKIIKTFFVQMYAAFPLSHFFAQKNNNVISLNHISIWDCIIVISLCVLFLLISKNFEKKNQRPKLGILFLALSGAIVPGMLTPLTAKYQSELYYGIAHMSVFVQYFGLSAAFLWIYLFIENLMDNKKKYRIVKLIQGGSAVVLAVVLLVNLQVTKSNVSAVSNAVKYPKESIITALEKGLLEGIQDNDIVVSIKNAPWDSDAFFSEFAKRKISAISYSAYEENYDEYKNQKKYFVNYFGTETGKAVAMCCSDEIEISKEGRITIPIEKLTFYVEGDGNIGLAGETITDQIDRKGKISEIEMNGANFMELQLY